MRNSKFSREFRDSTVQLILNNNESVLKQQLTYIL